VVRPFFGSLLPGDLDTQYSLEVSSGAPQILYLSTPVAFVQLLQGKKHLLVEPWEENEAAGVKDQQLNSSIMSFEPKILVRWRQAAVHQLERQMNV